MARLFKASSRISGGGSDEGGGGFAASSSADQKLSALNGRLGGVGFLLSSLVTIALVVVDVDGSLEGSSEGAEGGAEEDVEERRDVRT